MASTCSECGLPMVDGKCCIVQTIEAYGVHDDDDGLWYETVADTPMEAISLIGESRHDNLDERSARMMLGKLRVRRLKIAVAGVAEFEPKRERPTKK